MFELLGFQHTKSGNLLPVMVQYEASQNTKAENFSNLYTFYTLFDKTLKFSFAEPIFK